MHHKRDNVGLCGNGLAMVLAQVVENLRFCIGCDHREPPRAGMMLCEGTDCNCRARSGECPLQKFVSLDPRVIAALEMPLQAISVDYQPTQATEGGCGCKK